MERSFLAPSNLSQNHKTITIISLFFCIIVSTQGYTLEGQWQLNKQYLSYTKQNPNVTFSFVNKIPQIGLFIQQDVLEGPKVGHTFTGTKRLTVYACKTLLYNYYVNESSLYLQSVSIGNNNRNCLMNQIQQITAKLNQTFYFDIAANKLILYYPSSNTSLTLTRYNPSNLNLQKGMYEQWNFVKLNSEQPLSSSQKEVYFGQTTIDSCGFAASFKYLQSQRNNIKTDMQQNSCDNAAITNTFDQTFFYLQNDRRMTLYDDKLNELAQLEFVKVIDQSELNSKKNIVKNGNTPKHNDEQNKTNSIDTNKPNNLETNNSKSHVQNQTQTTDKPFVNNTTVKSENSSTTPTINSQKSSSNVTQVTPKQDSPSGLSSATDNPTPSNLINYATPSTINFGNSSNPPNQQNSITPNTSTGSNTKQNALSINTNSGNALSTNTINAENSTAKTNSGTLPTNHTVNNSTNTSNNPQSVPNNSNPLVNISHTQIPAIQTPVNISNNLSSSRPLSIPPSIQNLLHLRNQTASSRLKISTDRQLPDCHCTPIRTEDELYPFDPKLLQNKWYLYSINGTVYNMSAYYYYFLIITPTRMIYYGGCDVKWSDYRLNGNTLSGIFTKKATKNTCLNPNQDENVLLPFFNEVKYINHQIKENVAYITFYGQKYNHISTFTTVAPIYPSNWP